ncbi:MAG: hypothetical protein IT292_02730 [Deltaproteobacteria bacterium]|nr:hypothetical protein [Deltaproteobacteria bacterium]
MDRVKEVKKIENRSLRTYLKAVPRDLMSSKPEMAKLSFPKYSMFESALVADKKNNENFLDKIKCFIGSKASVEALSSLSLMLTAEAEKRRADIYEAWLDKTIVAAAAEKKSPWQQFAKTMKNNLLYMNPTTLGRKLVEYLTFKKNARLDTSSDRLNNVIKELSQGDDSIAQALTEAVEMALRSATGAETKPSSLSNDIDSGPTATLVCAKKDQIVRERQFDNLEEPTKDTIWRGVTIPPRGAWTQNSSAAWTRVAKIEEEKELKHLINRILAKQNLSGIGAGSIVRTADLAMDGN